MKNEFKEIGDIVLLKCLNPTSTEHQSFEVTIDRSTFDKIKDVDTTWEVSANPMVEEDGQPFTIAAIIHNQFVELKHVVAGVADIPTNDDNVPKSITAEEYIKYLNDGGIIVHEDERGFLYPISHIITDAKWDEGVLYINGNMTDNRLVNLLKVKVKGLTPKMCLSYVDDELVYKRKR